MSGANIIDGYARLIEQVVRSIRQINRFLQMNAMKFGNIVQSISQTKLHFITFPRLLRTRLKLGALIRYTRKLFSRIPRLARMCERRSLLRRNTPEIIVRTDKYLTESRKLFTTFQWIDFYQSFLNEPSQLQQQNRDVNAELEAVIKMLEYHLETTDKVLNHC